MNDKESMYLKMAREAHQLTEFVSTNLLKEYGVTRADQIFHTIFDGLVREHQNKELKDATMGMMQIFGAPLADSTPPEEKPRAGTLTPEEVEKL